MSSLVAYDSSDESEESDAEDYHSSPPNGTKESKEDKKTHISHESEPAETSEKNEEPGLPISDDEDDFIPVNPVSHGLYLPPPKHEKQHTPEEAKHDSKSANLLLDLPKPKHEKTAVKFIDDNEDALEDFVRPKHQELSVAHEKPPPVEEHKKRKKIQITVPELTADSDEEEDNVSKKARQDLSTKPKGKCGLFAVLPPAKHVTVSKDQGKKFMPSSISKNITSTDIADTEGKDKPKIPLPSPTLAPIKSSTDSKFKSNMFVPASLTRKSNQSSQSAFNLETGMMIVKTKSNATNKGMVDANVNTELLKDDKTKNNETNKNKSIPLAGVPMDDEDSDDDDNMDESSNFFSIGTSSVDNSNKNEVSSLPGVSKDKQEEIDASGSGTLQQNEPLTFSETAGPETQDAPLQFKKTVQPYHGYGQYGVSGSSYYNAGTSGTAGGYSVNQQYNMANIEEEDSGGEEKTDNVEEPSYSEEGASGDFMKDQEFLKMQGKSKRGKEEINFIDVRQDDQIHDVNIMKNISEETNVMSYSKKKNKDMPSSQQKRKHQITYLAFRAKERELELKNQWADNRSSKRQTQAKYGF